MFFFRVVKTNLYGLHKQRLFQGCGKAALMKFQPDGILLGGHGYAAGRQLGKGGVHALHIGVAEGMMVGKTSGCTP